MSIAKQIAGLQDKQRRTITVPQWVVDGTPLQIYVSDLTGTQLDKLQRKHKGFPEVVTMGSMVDLIILKAEDADGNRIFSLEDKLVLLDLPYDQLLSAASQVLDSIQSVEDQEKN